MIIVRESTTAGRGVFALRDIYPGTIIEKSPVITFRTKNAGWAGEHIVEWTKDRSAFMCGKSSFLNHSDVPNASLEIWPTDQEVRTIACRKIKAGEEVTIHYGNFRPWDKT